MSLALAALRAVDLAAGALLIGALLLERLSGATAPRRLAWIGWAVSVLALPCALAATVTAMADGWPEPRLLLAALTGTTYGGAWLARLALLLVTALLLRRWPAAALAAALAALVASVAVGHAAAATGAARLPRLALDALHLGVAALWLGGLGALARFLRSMPPQAPRLHATVVRFGNVALVCVLLAIGTGIAKAVLVLPDWSALADTDYGQALCLKLLALTAMLFLAARNRFVLTARLAATPALGAAALYRSVMGEAVLGLTLIVLAAWLGRAMPPMP